MNKNIELGKDTLRAIARYEKTLKRYASERAPETDDEEIIDFVIPEKYRITPDDLYAALKNIKAEDPPFNEFCEYWFDVLDANSDVFGLDIIMRRALVKSGDKPHPMDILPVTEWTCFAGIWNDLRDDIDAAFKGYESEDRDIKDDKAGDVLDLDAYLGRMELFFENADKPLNERRFSRSDRYSFMKMFLEDDIRQNASADELELCRIFTDGFCEEDDMTALIIKGCGCYGGNEIYPCDWEASRDCLLKLLDMTDDGTYANSLGYIYYYGRCSGGAPEYEKAFEMFTLGAACGFYESMYKLADMYRQGLACRKSPSAARRMYENVFGDTLRKFVQGNDRVSFSEAALRMGHMYLDGTITEADPATAYMYYLEADLAARMRLEKSDFFGDVNTSVNASNALAKVRSMLGEDFFRDSLMLDHPYAVETLFNGNWRVRLTAEEAGDGDLKLTFERIAVKEGQTPEPVLLVIPELSICRLTAKIEYIAVDARTTLEPGREYIIDDISGGDDGKTREIYFSFNGRRREWLSCSSFRMDAERNTEDRGRLIRFVSVEFTPGGTTYDYICDIDDAVEPGNRVMIPESGGETEAVVTEVFARYEDLVPIPLDKYKIVIRKV